MAVYTKITKQQLENYLTNYDLGNLISFAEIISGIDNSNYKITTNKGEYILTLYEKRINKADLPFFISLMSHLANKNFLCPVAQKMKNAQTLGTLANRPCSIVSFLQGTSIQSPTPNECFIGGQTLAKLHLAAGDFNGKLENALNVNGWKTLLEKTKQNADEIENGLSNLIENEFDFLQKTWPKDLPVGIIHADFFKNNVFFQNNKISGVIDFYFACNDMLAYDLAIAINAWAFSEGGGEKINFLPRHAKEFLQGYENERPLTKQEKENFNILLRGAALRFLLTRIYDFLNVPKDALVNPHNPKEFSSRLRFLIENKESLFA